MNIGIPKEVKENEGRVGLTPLHASKLCRAGHTLYIQEEAGLRAGYPDMEYRKAGGKILKTAREVYTQAELIVKVKEPLGEEYSFLRRGQTLFTYLHLASSPELVRVLLQKNITGIDYATVRTKDGKLPLLEPMSEIAGKLAPQIGARLLEQHMGEGRGILLAGSEETKSATVIVIGGGVVGTHATQIAAGMGARVFLLEKNPAKITGLAKAFAAQKNVRPLLSTPKKFVSLLKHADLVITAVLIPGGKAPILIYQKDLASMPANSVIVDVSIDQGGCVEGARTTTHSSPTIRMGHVLYSGLSNIPSLVPATATKALTHRTFPYVQLLAHDGFVRAVKKNSALAQGVNTYAGSLVYKQLAQDLGEKHTSLATLLK
jgi:alanine dehydrogenase